MSIKINTNSRTTYTISDSDFPDVDFEVSSEPVDNNYIDSVKVSRIDDDRVAVGYLSSDDNSRDPLNESDGSGRIYSAHRHSLTHEKMQEALGLDSEWEPATDLIDDNDIRDQYIEYFCDNMTVIDCLSTGYVRQDGQTDIDFQTACANENFDDWRGCTYDEQAEAFKLELWRKGRENGTIGMPYTISLDVYDHSGQVYSMSGEGMNCSWDTSKGGAVWVPDKYCLENIMAQPEAERKECAKEYCRDALKEYNAWLSGDVYGVCVAICDSTTGEEIESDEYWGYYTSEHAIQQMNEEVESTVRWELKNSSKAV